MMQPCKGHDIKEEVRQQILALAAEIDPQSRGKLPSETKLADWFGVSRLTIRTVLAELAAEGKVRRKHGAGTFFVSNAVEKDVVCFHSRVHFEKVIQQYGMRPRIEVERIAAVPADDEVSARLSLRKGDKVVQIRKLFLANDRLAVYNVMALPACYSRKADLELYRLPRDAIWEMVNRVAYRKGVSHSESEIMRIAATNCARTPVLLPYLKEKDAETTPFLVLKTVFHDVMQEPLLFSTCYINTDIINYGAVLAPPRKEPNIHSIHSVWAE